MSSYKQLSGAQKRKLKQKRNVQIKTIKGSMDKYVSSSSQSIDDEDLKIAHSDFENEGEVQSEIVKDLEPELNSPSVNANEPILSLCLSDVGLWPQEITDVFREYFVNNKPTQNIEHISNSKCVIGNKERCLNASNFYRKKKNNELVNREWMVYSPSQKSVFCYICKLFSTSDQALCKGGFSYWKNTAERLREHENSMVHRNSVLCLSQRLSSLSRIDSVLVEEYQAEYNYWRKVLFRVVASVKFLCERGLALFGNDETVESAQNGNFLGILELLSKFDPFIADHLSKYGNPGSGNVNYLSSTTVTEIINIMSQKVLNVIVQEIQKAKYFGLIVDSTPDITHCDQLSVVLRYVDDEGEPIERFLKFIHIHSHKSFDLTDTIVTELNELNIDIKNCRGQSYDNASNMSGQYSGLQARIKSISPLAIYVPCSAHSLNLVGQNSVDCCEHAVSYFGLVQKLYVFFSISTHRWEILTSKLAGADKLTLKPLAATRWSAAAEATKCIKKNYRRVMEGLQEISEDMNEKAATRHEAKSLLKKMEKFETAVLTVVWDSILQRINKVNKTLQAPGLNVSSLIPLYDSLITFIQSVRNDYQKYELEASSLVDETYCTKRKRKIPKSRMLDDSLSKEVNFSSRDSFIVNCHYVICDSLISELEKRKAAYKEIDSRFSFLMKKTSEEIIKKEAKHFQELYSSDIDEDFEDEVYQFFHFLSEDEDISTPSAKLKTIRSQNISHTFPNVDTALQILLTMPISNCSSERSFSVMKRIKNRLRSSTKQDKLSSLSILSIECDLTAKLDFEDVIDTFAANKARRKAL